MLHIHTQIYYLFLGLKRTNSIEYKKKTKVEKEVDEYKKNK